ncbi:endospore germination permease [Paenibacillus qinlingensis]|uniref:Spore germination protein (Amino acid permease) n=1 Tax=Paenibacillus qinlingensis TaxID=1837343 RepID=A0ABU1P0S7_9BACL|nr:endospore germination permease [Paenibacillus qinlingensis]MDR6553350.1 spore germination protein (amino acid permease) [Paenibacillus qinlingensis]
MTRVQLFAFILQTQIGIAVLSFPYDLHKAAGADGWISVLVAGAAVQLLLVGYAMLCQRFPRQHLYQFAPLIVGKWLGNLVNVVYILHFTITSSLILLMEMMFVELWILPHTNPGLIIVANCIVCLYMAKENIRVIARYHALITLLIIIMVAIMLTNFSTMDFRYLLPVGQEGFQAILLGVKSSVLSFLGFEVVLVLNSDIQTQGKSIIPPILWANGLATAFFLLIVFICYLNFSPDSLDFIPQPVPYYLNGISLPFLERLDLIFLSIWLVKVTSTQISYLYSAGKGLGLLFHRNEHKKAIYYLVPLVCLTGIFWRSESRVQFFEHITQFDSFIVLSLPIVLLLFAWLRGKRGQLPL